MKFGIQLAAALVLSSPVLIVSTTTQALSSSQVNAIAQGITVQLEGSEGFNGSGFIIERAGNRYKILTCKHVIENGQTFTIVTSDKKQHPARQIIVKPFGKNLDLAIVEFESSQSYSVATLGDSKQVESGQIAYVAGFPANGGGQKRSFFLFNEGKINARAGDSLNNGYELVYNINTLPGMSGGPVLNEQGHVIGIHGQGDQAEDVTVLLEASEVNPGVVVKSGFNYAIPIDTFKKFATVAKVNFIQKTPLPPQNPGLNPPTHRTPSTFTPQPPAPEPKVKAVPVKGIYDPYAITRERSKNKISFNQKFLDKIITIRGQVAGVSELNPPRPNFAQIQINSPTQTGIGRFRYVYCKGVPSAIAENLKEDEILTVQGTYRKPKYDFYLDIGLEDCKVVN